MSLKARKTRNSLKRFGQHRYQGLISVLQVAEVKSKPESVQGTLQYTPLDEQENKEIDRKANLSQARVFYYAGEKECDANMQVFLDCIDAVKGSTGGTGFSAIKITALGRPEILVIILHSTILESESYDLD